MPINPAFHRFQKEGALVGRLLAAFGELEISVCDLAKKAVNIGDSVMAALYCIRSTRSRLAAADALMRPIFVSNNLEAAYTEAIGAVFYCLKIRNQFAHCNWADDASKFPQPGEGLFFADLAVSAETPDFEIFWKHVDVPLFESHEAYFEYALEAVRSADHELAVKQGKLSRHWWPKPPMLAQPPRHNPEGLHIPPWITEAAKALHVKRAQAAQAGAPTPTPAHLAMEARRVATRERRKADRERDAAARSPPEPPKE
jgi:hypothetical protein